jgi:segregation and condensation protein B
MDEAADIKCAIECLLFAAGSDGLSPSQIAGIMGMTKEEAADICYDLQADLEREKRGVQIVEIAGVFQMTTRPEYAPFLQKMAREPEPAGISQAALEVLAIIAYRQPVTRLDVEEVRGVKSDRAIQSLLAKRLIQEVGRAEGPGRPILYGTTREFLEHFGLGSLEDLPPPPAYIPPGELQAETSRFTSSEKQADP